MKMIGLHIKLTVVMLFSATAVTVLNSCTDNDQTIVDGVVVDDVTASLPCDDASVTDDVRVVTVAA